MPLVIKTRTGEVSVEEDAVAGPLVVIRILPDVTQSIDDARMNVEACVSAAESRRSRLLVDIRRAEPISAEVRHYYSGERLTQWFSALAVLVEASPMGRIMGNLYVRIAQPGVPTCLFNSEEQAMEWLRKGTL